MPTLPHDGPYERVSHVNYTLIIISLVALGLIGGGLHLSRSYFLQKNVTTIYDQAEAADQAGDADLAIKKYTQYIEFSRAAVKNDSDDGLRATALARAATLLEPTASTPSERLRVMRLYEEALRMDPHRNDVRWQLIPLLLQFGRYNDIGPNVANLRKDKPDPRHVAELAYYAGAAQQGLRRYRDAQQEYYNSLAADPKQAVSYLALVDLLQSRRDDAALPPNLESLSAVGWSTLTAILKPVKDNQPYNQPAAIQQILHQFLQASPSAQNTILASRFWLQIRRPEDLPPQPRVIAQTRQRAIFAAADYNRNNKLDGDERWHPEVPALTSFDPLGDILPEALITRLELGDRQARLNHIAQLLERAQAELPADASEEDSKNLLLCQVDLQLAQIDSEAEEKATKAREEGLRLAQQGWARPNRDPRFAMTLAQLELAPLANVPANSPEVAARIDNAKALLNDGLTQLKLSASQAAPISPAKPATPRDKTPEKAAAKSDAEDWKTPTLSFNRRELETQIRFTLADLALTQAESEKDAVKKSDFLAVVAEQRAALGKIDADLSLTEFLDLRTARLQKDFAQVRRLALLLQTQMEKNSTLSRRIGQFVGQAFIELGSPDLCLNIYRTLVANDPLWIAGRQGLAETLVRLGRLDEARQQYQTLLAVPGAAESLLQLVIVQQANRPPTQRKWDEADLAVAAGRQVSPNSARRLILEAELEVAKASTLATIAANNNDQATLAQAKVHMEAAENLLTNGLEQQSKNVQLHVAHVSTALRRFDWEPEEQVKQAEVRLTAARKEVGEQTELDRLEVAIAERQDPSTGLERLKSLESRLEQKPDNEEMTMRMALASAFARLGDRDIARTQWELISSANPDALEPRQALLQFMIEDFASGTVKPDEKQWSAILEEVTRIEGTPYGTSAFAQAQRILRETEKVDDAKAQLAQAEDLLKAVSRTRPYWSAVPRLMGTIEEKRGRTENAVDAYQRAVALGDRSSQVLTKLIDHYRKKSQFAEADRLLQQMANENLNFVSGEVARLAMQLAYDRNQFDQYLTVATELSKNTQNPSDRVNVALTRFARGDRDPEIMETLKKIAYEETSDNPGIWAAYVGCLVQLKQWNDAEQAVNDATSKLKTLPPVDRALGIARLNEILTAFHPEKRPEFAEKASIAYQEAIDADPQKTENIVIAADFALRISDQKRANQLLSQLLDPGRAVPIEVRQMAEQRKAMLMATSGGYDDIQKALTALKQSASKSGTKAAENLRFQLQLLRQLQAVDTRKQRREAFEALQKATELNVVEQLEFAMLLNSLGDWPKAQQAFRTLLEQAPGFARGLASYASAVLDRKPFEAAHREEVQSLLDRLRKLEPRSWRTAAVDARLNFQIGEADRALARLADYCEQRVKKDTPPDAALLMEQENPQELLTELMAVARNTANQALAASVVEAVRLLNQGQKDAAAEQLNQPAALPYLTVAKFAPLMLTAKLLESQQRPEAEQYYRQYLELAPKGRPLQELTSYLIRSNRVKEALDMLEQLSNDLLPANLADIIVLAAQKSPQDNREALLKFRETLSTAADSVPGAEKRHILARLGNLDDALGQHDLAIEQYRIAIAADPRNIVAKNNLAYLLARKGTDLSEAENAIRQAISAAGPRGELLDTLAAVLLAQDKPAEALKILTPILSMSADPIVHLKAAECYSRLNQLDQARRSLQKADELGLNDPQIHPLDRLVAETLREKLQQTTTPMTTSTSSTNTP